MEKTSKVKQVTANGSWESQYGTLFKFEVSFENGDIGDYNSKLKEQTAFVVGVDASYEITAKDYQGRTFYSVKPVKKAMVGGGGYSKPSDPDKDKRIARMSVLKGAIDLVVAGHIKFDDVFRYAQFFEAYVDKGIDCFRQMYQAEEKKNLFKADKGGIEQNFANDAIDDMNELPF